jgi:hypothetical protein
MKNKLFVIMLSAAMILSIFSGCGAKNTEPETIVPAPQQAELKTEVQKVPDYSGLLDHYYELISGGGDSFDPGEGESGVWEIITNEESNEALEVVGYAIQDISGDGIAELLIGAISGQGTMLGFGSEIYAVYTSVNNVPALSFEGWGRSSYRTMGAGKFFYHGSNGAMYSIFGTYTISPDGGTLCPNDYYFTYEKDESFEEIGYYHNTSGVWDKAVSEEMDISGEEFWQIEEELADQIQVIDLIPFARYKTASEDRPGPQVRILWLEEMPAGFTAYNEFVADMTEHQTSLVFTTDGRAEDFTVLALTLEDPGESGEIVFATQDLYSLGALTPEHPLVLGMTFYGSIPSYGISYVDESGATRSYAISTSGKDGSLMLVEIATVP